MLKIVLFEKDQVNKFFDIDKMTNGRRAPPGLQQFTLQVTSKQKLHLPKFHFKENICKHE